MERGWREERNEYVQVTGGMRVVKMMAESGEVGGVREEKCLLKTESGVRMEMSEVKQQGVMLMAMLDRQEM